MIYDSDLKIKRQKNLSSKQLINNLLKSEQKMRATLFAIAAAILSMSTEAVKVEQMQLKESKDECKGYLKGAIVNI